MQLASPPQIAAQPCALLMSGGVHRQASPPRRPERGEFAAKSLELKPGAGAPIAAGQYAVVQYTGWLYEASAPDNKGKQFDSSAQQRPAVPLRGRRRTGDQGLGSGRRRHEGGRPAPTHHSRRISPTATAAPAASFRPARRWCSMSTRRHRVTAVARSSERVSIAGPAGPIEAIAEEPGARAAAATPSCAIRTRCTAAPWTTRWSRPLARALARRSASRRCASTFAAWARARERSTTAAARPPMRRPSRTYGALRWPGRELGARRILVRRLRGAALGAGAGDRRA